MEDKDKLKTKLNKLVNTAVDKADRDESLNHFEIEIKVHQEKANVRTTTKKIENLY